jgi:hypothetical protein
MKALQMQVKELQMAYGNKRKKIVCNVQLNQVKKNTFNTVYGAPHRWQKIQRSN